MDFTTIWFEVVLVHFFSKASNSRKSKVWCGLRRLSWPIFSYVFFFQQVWPNRVVQTLEMCFSAIFPTTLAYRFYDVSKHKTYKTIKTPRLWKFAFLIFLPFFPGCLENLFGKNAQVWMEHAVSLGLDVPKSVEKVLEALRFLDRFCGGGMKKITWLNLWKVITGWGNNSCAPSMGTRNLLF